MGDWFLYRTGQTFTVVKRTPSGTDVYGNTVYSETRTSVRGCAAWPQAESETQGGRDTSTVGEYALFPPGTDIDARDAVEINGQLWEVDGSPEIAVSPLTGTQGGVEVRIKRVTG